MMVAGVVMIIIGINMIITMLINSYLMDLILQRFKMEDDYDEAIKNNICTIYDIINYNRLVKPRRYTDDERSKSNNQEGYKKV